MKPYIPYSLLFFVDLKKFCTLYKIKKSFVNFKEFYHIYLSKNTSKLDECENVNILYLRSSPKVDSAEIIMTSFVFQSI